MSRNPSLLALLGLSLFAFPACTNNNPGASPDDDDDGGADDDDDTAPCPAIVRTTPENNDDNHFFRSDLIFEYNSPPQGVDISLVDSDGVDVPGTTTASSTGRTWRFAPDNELTANTHYVATADWSCVTVPAVLDFSTGPYGSTVNDPSGMIGRTYSLDIASATFAEPAGIGPVLQAQIGELYIQMMAIDDSDLDNGVLHFYGALGDTASGGSEQRACAESMPFTLGPDRTFGTEDDTPASWTDPDFEIGPTTVTLNINGASADLENLIIAGTMHPDLDDIRGASFDGVVDTRPLAESLEPGNPAALCELVEETVGVPCIPCSSDGADLCLVIVAIDMIAEYIPELTLQDWSCVDIIDDAACAKEAAVYSTNDDGTYDLCPEHSSNR